MATFQTRNGATRAIIRKNGASLSKTFDTSEEAEQWAYAVETRLAANEGANGLIITNATPVRAIVAKFLREVTPNKRGSRSETQMLNALLDRFAVFDKTVAAFGPADIETIRDCRLRGSKDYAPVANGTVIREMGMLSGCFTHAIKKWKAPFPANPVHGVDRPKAPPHREARITDEEVKKVCAALGWEIDTPPTHANHYVAIGLCLAVETAMRRGEILSLTWQHVRYDECEVFLPITKNGESRKVALTARAEELIKLLPQGTGNERCFPLSVAYFSNLWQIARKKAGVEFRFHDARHEATTRLAPLMGDVIHLSKVTGHKNLKMLAIYINPTSKELRAKMDRKAA